jgi:hypothetical protein
LEGGGFNILQKEARIDEGRRRRRRRRTRTSSGGSGGGNNDNTKGLNLFLSSKCIYLLFSLLEAQ